MRHPILGPVLADLDSIGLNHDEVVLATAYYSKTRLDQLVLRAERVDLLVRLDPHDATEWIAGSIEPDGLLAFLRRQRERNAEVRVFCSPTAHSKAYVGASAFFVGSANLTVRGFGGTGNEILWFEDDVQALRRMRAVVREYRRGLREVTAEELEDYVSTYGAAVRAARRLRRNQQESENVLPRKGIPRRPRLGDYSAFLDYLQRDGGEPARLILERTHGQGQLSGHIKRNFFGLRQFLIAYPLVMRELVKQDPGSYQLHRDVKVQPRLKAFVDREAADEEDLKVDTWRTYLPESAGGKPKTGGGTSGNLKRMLPLVARYLQRRLK